MLLLGFRKSGGAVSGATRPIVKRLSLRSRLERGLRRTGGGGGVRSMSTYIPGVCTPYFFCPFSPISSWAGQVCLFCFLLLSSTSSWAVLYFFLFS